MSRWLPCLLVTALSLVAVQSVSAQSLPQMFSEANAAFFQGDFAKATKGYQALVEAGVEDADVYYNLGTAQARAGHCGEAIVALSRSLRLSAGDDAAEANLRACQTQLGKRRAQRDGEATVQTRPPWSDAVLASISLDALAWVLLVLNAALFTVLLARRGVHQETARLSLAVTAWLLALAVAMSAIALTVKAEWFRPGRGAVVLHEQAPLREGPDPRAKLRGETYEGEPGRVLQTEGDFVRVRLNRGPEGWMQRTDVGTL